MKNTLAPQSGTAFILNKGQFLKIIDPLGQQVCDLFCFDKNDSTETLSSGRSIDYADKIFLTTGSTLFSNRSNEMLAIVEDTCGRHDFLLTPCSLRMFQIVSHTEEYHKSCDENLNVAFNELNLGTPILGTTFNIFMNVEVQTKGDIRIHPPLSKPKDHIIFKALRDLIVGICSCSHEETNAGTCKPIQWEIY